MRRVAVNRLLHHPRTPYRLVMHATPLARINTALDRIDAAVRAHTAAAAAGAKRHEALRARVAEAVAALDDVIARGGA